MPCNVGCVVDARLDYQCHHVSRTLLRYLNRLNRRRNQREGAVSLWRSVNDSEAVAVSNERNTSCCSGDGEAVANPVLQQLHKGARSNTLALALIVASDETAAQYPLPRLAPQQLEGQLRSWRHSLGQN